MCFIVHFPVQKVTNNYKISNKQEQENNNLANY